MDSLKDFLLKKDYNNLNNELKKTLNSPINEDIKISSVPEKMSELSIQTTEKLINYIKSESFLEDVSKEVGIPEEKESKEDFVKRGLKIIEDYLLRIL